MADRNDVTISTRVTREMKARLERRATSTGQTPGAAMTALVSAALDPNVVSVELTSEMVKELDDFAGEMRITRGGAMTYCLVAALSHRQELFGSLVRLKDERLLQAMKGDGHRG